MVSCINSVILNLFSVYLIHTYNMGIVGVKKQWHCAIQEEKFFYMYSMLKFYLDSASHYGFEVQYSRDNTVEV